MTTSYPPRSRLRCSLLSLLLHRNRLSSLPLISSSPAFLSTSSSRTYPTSPSNTNYNIASHHPPSSPVIHLFGQTIIPPSPRTRQEQRYKVPFYRLRTHSIPVRWHLYRSLLRLAPDDVHKQQIRRRWRLSARRQCRSPRNTLVHLRLEHRWLEDYKAYHAHMAADAADEIVPSIAARFSQLEDSAKRWNSQIQRDALVVEEYVSGFCCPVSTLGTGTQY